MSSLQEVKSRISSVNTTRKITKAMELVSTSKLRKAKQNYEEVISYSNRIKEVLNNLNNKIKDWNEIFKVNTSLPKTFIVITSDIGLCGGYNNNIFKLFRENYAQEDYVVVIGNKGLKFISKLVNKEKILLSFTNIGDAPNYDVVLEITNKISALLMANKISSIHLLETKYVNSLTYQPVNNQIYPFFDQREKESLSSKSQASNSIEFEPDPRTVVKKAIPLCLGAIIYASIASSKVSEISSRRIAMENASDNATDIIDLLEKEYNKARQAKITQEITEIVSGAGNE